MKRATVRRRDEAEVVSFAWGQLTWSASAALGNSDDLTIGRCVIKQGRANPRHVHDDCAEVLVVEQGTVAHTVAEGEEAVLRPGDAITIPAGLRHSARNIGEDEAILTVAYPTGRRSYSEG